MIVQLSENDRIVLSYDSQETVTVVVQDSELDDIYMWLSRKHDSDKWDLHWRGNWKSASDNFFEFVQDVEPDTVRILTERALRGKTCKVCGNVSTHFVHGDDHDGWHPFEEA